MADKPKIDHNVYILGAGFSYDGGIPLIRDFLERMADSVEWLYEHGRDHEAEAILRVFEFRLRAAGAAYRAYIDVDNIEELFSLASASEGETLATDVTTAIAATIDYARLTSKPPHLKVTLKVPEKGGGWGEVYTTKSAYSLYAGIISGSFCENSTNMRNTVITFNYDTLLEDALSELKYSFSYGLSTSSAEFQKSSQTTIESLHPKALQIYKLHGSINWSDGTKADDRIRIFGSYDDLRGSGEGALLIPPTWRKVFGGHLIDVWEKAIKALNAATRIIVLGFSMPPTDTHFKYLLAAGLQKNISLRKFLFVNPGLDEGTPKTRDQLQNNLFRILRPELEEKGVIELLPYNTAQFLLSKRTTLSIKREFPKDFQRIEAPINGLTYFNQ